MNKLVCGLGFVIFLVGCSSVATTGVQQIGKGKYTVSSTVKGITMATEENSSDTRGSAIWVANKFCVDKGYDYANVIEESVERGRTATSILIFGCE